MLRKGSLRKGLLRKGSLRKGVIQLREMTTKFEGQIALHFDLRRSITGVVGPRDRKRERVGIVPFARARNAFALVILEAHDAIFGAFDHGVLDHVPGLQLRTRKLHFENRIAFDPAVKLCPRDLGKAAGLRAVATTENQSSEYRRLFRRDARPVGPQEPVAGPVPQRAVAGGTVQRDEEAGRAGPGGVAVGAAGAEDCIVRAGVRLQASDLGLNHNSTSHMNVILRTARAVRGIV